MWNELIVKTECHFYPYAQFLFSVSFRSLQGRNHGRKVEGDQGLGPNTGALASHARPQAGLGVKCGRGLSPPAVRVRGYHPWKICENSDAESCILVTTIFISGLPKK